MQGIKCRQIELFLRKKTQIWIESPGRLWPQKENHRYMNSLQRLHLRPPDLWVLRPQEKTYLSLDFIFYHSCLRIAIEGIFTWLTQVYGMLQKQMPKKYFIKKIMAVVSCLCHLHNFWFVAKKSFSCAILQEGQVEPKGEWCSSSWEESWWNVTATASGGWRNHHNINLKIRPLLDVLPPQIIILNSYAKYIQST